MITIAIVGRPNVGKSTLFNILSADRKAIIHNSPGITRDYKTVRAVLGNLEFEVIDTAGLYFSKKLSPLEEEINNMTKAAIAKSSAILFVVDGREGLIGEDKSIDKFLRKTSVPTMLVINKCDVSKAEKNTSEFFFLGYENICKISAEHRMGLNYLYEFINNFATPADSPQEVKKDKIRIATIGRPNVGKSTFINALLGEKRLITSSEPGTTRDSIGICLAYKDVQFEFIDTAGLRKKRNIDRASIEQLTVTQTIESIDLADITILMIDINMPLESQDLRIADLAISRGKPLILVVNKIDTIKDQKALALIKDDISHLINIKSANTRDLAILYISALHKKNINQILNICLRQYKTWSTEIKTSMLNNWLHHVLEEHQPPMSKSGKRIRIKYINQIKSRPPTFYIFTNKEAEIPDSYIKYLINKIKDDFSLEGVPVRMIPKQTSNPYVK